MTPAGPIAIARHDFTPQLRIMVRLRSVATRAMPTQYPRYARSMHSKPHRLRTTFVVLIIVGGALGAAFGLGAFSGPSLTPAQIAARAAAARARKIIAAEKRAVRRAEAQLETVLPTKLATPAPTVPAQLFANPLRPHEVVGFVPYYTLSTLSPADFTDTSVLCYFGLGLTANGSLMEPVSWVSLQSDTFATFLASARAANDETLLTVSSFARSTIGALTRNASTTAPRLAGELAPLVTSTGLSGVDIDIEGRWSADRAGFVRFMNDFSKAFRSADPKSVILLDTYPQSAAGTRDFFNIKKLAPDIDQFFVMEYAMENVDNASANAPAFSPNLGVSTVQTLIQYKKLVPSSKIILGLPFYGYDFSTMSGRPGADTTSPDPEAVTYEAIASIDRPALWDPVSETLFTRFEEAKQWHETWYDNPVSLALKVALAIDFHEAGIGVWALGMEGSDAAMLSALDGGTAPLKGSLQPAPASAASN